MSTDGWAMSKAGGMCLCVCRAGQAGKEGVEEVEEEGEDEGEAAAAGGRRRGQGEQATRGRVQLSSSSTSSSSSSCRFKARGVMFVLMLHAVTLQAEEVDKASSSDPAASTGAAGTAGAAAPGGAEEWREAAASAAPHTTTEAAAGGGEGGAAAVGRPAATNCDRGGGGRRRRRDAVHTRWVTRKLRLGTHGCTCRLRSQVGYGGASMYQCTRGPLTNQGAQPWCIIGDLGMGGSSSLAWSCGMI